MAIDPEIERTLKPLAEIATSISTHGLKDEIRDHPPDVQFALANAHMVGMLNGVYTRQQLMAGQERDEDVLKELQAMASEYHHIFEDMYGINSQGCITFD